MRTHHPITSFGRCSNLPRFGAYAAGCAWVLGAGSAWSQDALQGAIRGDRAYEQRNTQNPEKLENIQLGPVQLGVGLTYSLEWEDNVRHVQTNEESDFIHRPQLDLRLAWAPTKDSVLRFGTGIGYTKYMDASDLDRLYLSPNSELAWDIPFKDFIFTVYDRFEYSQDIASQGALTGVGQFPRFDNTAGFRVSYQPSRYLFQAGYGHQNFWTTEAQFDYLDRSSEQLFGRAAYRFADRTLAGIEASGAFTSYKLADQRDNTSVSFGPFADWQITDPLRLTLRGGYVHYDYDPSTLIPTASGVDGYYLGGEVNHTITANLRHTLNVTREIRQGLNRGSEYNQVLRPQYVLTWSFHRYASAALYGFYEKGKEPGTLSSEDYSQKSVGITVNYQLTSRWNTSLGYRFIRRDSDLANRDYSANSILFSTSYRF